MNHDKQYVLNNTHFTAVKNILNVLRSILHVTHKFLISRSVSSLSGVIYFSIPSLMRSDSVNCRTVITGKITSWLFNRLLVI